MSENKSDQKHILEQYFIPFYHLEKRYPLFPGKNSRSIESQLFNLTESEFALVRQNSKHNAKQAAIEILKDDAITDLIDKLPFDGTETIVGLGDSITEDDQGWFNILMELLEISTDNARFNFINAGITGNTTSDALRRIDRDVLLHEPDWVFVNIGLQDVQRLNITPDRTLHPLSETWENLNSIQDVLSEYLTNDIVWISPTLVVPELIKAHPLNEFTMDNSDVIQLIEIASGKRGLVIDPQSKRMGEAPDAWNYLSDGINHSISGHMNTVREVLKGLATYTKS